MDKTTYKFSINSSTSTLNIGNSITSLNLNVGTNLSSGTINIGSSAKTTNISGNTTMLGDLNVSSGIINASNFKMYSTNNGTYQIAWMDTIGTTLTSQVVIGYNNASQVYIGGQKSSVVIGGDKGIVNIANDGLSATGRVNIATGPNVAGSEINIGGGSSTININRPLSINYNPSAITHGGQIGWSQRWAYNGVQTAYHGGDRVYFYGYFNPGVYLCNFSSIAFRQTNLFKALFYYTPQQPVNYIVDLVGGGYSDESENDNAYGYSGFVRITGTGVISLQTASYIGLLQQAYAVNSPIDFLGYVVRITRIA